jgi:pimeloyl-ACP methyl ester carboxylesterase
VIASAAAGVPTDSTEVFSSLNSVLPKATSAKDSADAKTYVNELVAVAYHERPRARLDSLVTALRDRSWFVAPPPPEDNYWSFSAMFGKYQPLEWWSQIRVPVLLVYGSADQRVPAKPSAERIAAVLHNAGNNEVTVQIHPDADHTFRLPPGPSGWPKTAPDYIPGLLEWIKKR